MSSSFESPREHRGSTEAHVLARMGTLFTRYPHLMGFFLQDPVGFKDVLNPSAIEGDLCILDILNAGCSKGHALGRWARHRGIEREEVMAIGDNYNDIEMLEFACIPVIMGNASDDLKQSGWHVTLANDQSGVAAAVEQLLRI